MSDSESYLKTAFLSQYNLIVLLGAAVFSLVSLSALPLLVAAGAELIYLGTVPNLTPFRRHVRSRREQARRAAEQHLLEKLLEDLSPNQRESYFSLRALRDKILENYQRLPGGAALVETSLRRIDGLLVAFVRLLSTLNNYRRCLSTTDGKALERELGELRAEISQEVDPRSKVHEVMKRRAEILEQRLERFKVAAQSREVISHQLASIDDFMRLMLEQSITLRDPDLIGTQLDHLAVEVQATDETIREMEKVAAFTEELHPVAPPQREPTR
jgi:hypothetical protein